ncbi:MAG: methyltransferase domain-containing protein [Planctomycetales bacterium]|nr:methyltransferase domain-containing protein [Planctomycetales bacterium]
MAASNAHTASDGPRPYSHPKTTAKVLSLLEKNELEGRRILDLGAGEGYLSHQLCNRLEQRGLKPRDVLTACDMFPDNFQVDRVACHGADLNGQSPFADESFDFVVCQEVIEHVPNQLHLIREIHRLLRPGGKAWITTPNVMNFNSRVGSLFTGMMPLFDVLPISNNDVVHCSGHISPTSLYYLYFFAKLAGFEKVDFAIDRVKRSAAFFCPPVFLAARVCKFFLDRKRRHLPYWEENKQGADALYAWQTFVGRTIILELTRGQKAAAQRLAA